MINSIINGDCIEVMSHIEDNSIDLVITSPPYNLGIKYDIYQDKISVADYYVWCRLWLKEVYRVLKSDGRFCLNHYLSCGDSVVRFAPLMDLNSLSQEIGFKHYGLAVWYDITLTKRTAWGSWLSASAPYINSPFEGILILYKDRWKKDKKGITNISKEEFMESCSGVWKIPTERKREHPAPFPIKLVERCIKLFSYEGDIVLDPFAGSCTSAVACKLNNRNYINIELSNKYCMIGKKRLEELKRD